MSFDDRLRGGPFVPPRYSAWVFSPKERQRALKRVNESDALRIDLNVRFLAHAWRWLRRAVRG